MELSKFKPFHQACGEHLAGAVGEVLNTGKKPCSIGFITTDDFYGCYLAWEFGKNIGEYYDWENGSEPEFLYQPLVDVVESCPEIDLCQASEEKWDFAVAFLTVLAENIKKIPNEVFQKNGYQREDVLFFATMSDGDYIEELLNASVKLFNTPETVKAYGLERGVYPKEGCQ